MLRSMPAARQRTAEAATTVPADGSAIMLADPRTGWRYPAADATSVVLSSTRQGWRSPLVVEVHRMASPGYDEHLVVGHRLLVNLGRPVHFGWRSGDRAREAVLPTGGLCLQSEGDSNAPSWTGEMLFAAVAIPPALVERLLEDRAPQPAETFAERRCLPETAAYGYARALARELSSPGEPTFAEALGLAFTLHLLAAHGAGTTSSGKRLAPRGKLGPVQLRAAAELAHARLGEGVTIEDMAEAAGYSPFQFARMFKATTGLAPHQFVLRLRLEKAERLLRAGGLGPAEIAAQVGFYDQAHLTNTFRRAYGLTPGAFAATM